MNHPSVSVVIPCFNVARTVAETIASVSAQTMDDFEIIAVDNNCTDATRDVLAEIGAREPRLRVVHQPVQGLSAARNGGITVAQSTYIAFLDGDDLWDADYLAAHLENLSDPEIGVSYSKVRLIDMESEPTGQVTRPQLHGLTPTDLLRSNPCTSLIVVRRDVFEKAGLFDEDLRSVEDQEWLFRAAWNDVKLRGIDRAIASYRISPGGLSADLTTMLASHGKLLDAAARIAPELVAANRRLARAGMLRYCARRAIDHDKGAAAARDYLWQMTQTAPEIVLREPMVTFKTMARVMIAGLKGEQRPAPSSLRTEEV